MSSYLASKTHRKWPKNCKNQTMLEKRKYTYLHKWSLWKVFSPVILLLFTLRTRSFAWKLQIMAVTSLYCFVAQQQTRTCRWQKSCSIYSKFGLEKIELDPSFQNSQGVTYKLLKPNNARLKHRSQICKNTQNKIFSSLFD